MNDLINNERMADAENLTKEVQTIIAEMEVFKDEYKRQVAPYKKRISLLEEAYLDKWLTDSNGNPVKIGMVIEKDGIRYKVMNRYQQIFMNYLGNPRVIALPEKKKREIDLRPSELKEYTIDENESKHS